MADEKTCESFEQALEVCDVAEEYVWIKRHMPGFRMIRQELVPHKGRAFDVLDLSNGQETVKRYFDVTGLNVLSPDTLRKADGQA